MIIDSWTNAEGYVDVGNTVELIAKDDGRGIMRCKSEGFVPLDKIFDSVGEMKGYFYSRIMVVGGVYKQDEPFCFPAQKSRKLKKAK